MRDIEFRGKQMNTNQWVYGYLYRNKGLYVICENIRYAEEEPILLDTVGQYTGLKDENGIKIFEGDIVEITKPCIWAKGIVIFKDGCFFIKTKTNKEILFPLYLSKINNFKLKVIGNIYDNPEMLEG